MPGVSGCSARSATDGLTHPGLAGFPTRSMLHARAEIVSAIQNVANVDQTGALAMHVAKVGQHRYPQPVPPEDANGYVPGNSKLAVELSAGTQEVLLSRDSSNTTRTRQERRRDRRLALTAIDFAHRQSHPRGAH
jgi:hypothetical protein